MTKPKRKTPEADLQIAIVQWFNLAYPDHAKWLHHSPNGGKRSITEAVRFKRMGTKAGFPDLVLFQQGFYQGFFQSQPSVGFVLELKAKGEKLKKNQLDWLSWLERRGFYVKWTDDFDHAVKLFNAYMHPIKPRVKV